MLPLKQRFRDSQIVIMTNFVVSNAGINELSVIFTGAHLLGVQVLSVNVSVNPCPAEPGYTLSLQTV